MYTHTHMYVYVYIYIYIHIHMYVYIYIYITVLLSYNTMLCNVMQHNMTYSRFPKFHRAFLGRDSGTLKSDIVSKKHPQ